ncbi:MAG: nicotinamide-nucleotide adenylyltransferase [Promethearchaeota archaeon]
MEEEILACIADKNVKYLQSGQLSKYIFPMPRREAHNKKVSHLVVRIFIMAITPENEILYLVQKRGKEKQSFPSYFTDSASGHVNYEKYLNLNKVKENALRELNEEFGIPKRSVRKIMFFNLNNEKDKFTKEIAYIFFGLVDYNINLYPNPEELEFDGSRFYTRKELEILLEQEKSVDYSKKIWKELLKTDLKSLFEKKNDLKQNKEEDIALLIGRFQPLHHGHIYIIKFILNSCNMLKIGIGSSQLSHTKNDPFTCEERKKFIRAALKKRGISPKKYKIYEIPDIFNAKKWVDHLISIVGEFDIIFSNSEWVRQLFQNKGIKVGKKLEIFRKKFSGTSIRDLIIKDNKKWVNLVPNEVIALMKEFNGIERIKSLSKIKEEHD